MTIDPRFEFEVAPQADPIDWDTTIARFMLGIAAADASNLELSST